MKRWFKNIVPDAANNLFPISKSKKPNVRPTTVAIKPTIARTKKRLRPEATNGAIQYMIGKAIMQAATWIKSSRQGGLSKLLKLSAIKFPREGEGGTWNDGEEFGLIRVSLGNKVSVSGSALKTVYRRENLPEAGESYWEGEMVLEVVNRPDDVFD